MIPTPATRIVGPTVAARPLASAQLRPLLALEGRRCAPEAPGQTRPSAV